jgi:hypothetical protein
MDRRGFFEIYAFTNKKILSFIITVAKNSNPRLLTYFPYFGKIKGDL